MKIEEFVEIMEDESIETKFPETDNALMGLNIIAKYLPKSGVEGADHDVIYACDVEKLVEAGITTEDAKKLKEINWMIYDGGYLAVFV